MASKSSEAAGVQIRRPDIANSLVHFTKGRVIHDMLMGQSTAGDTAFDVLLQIIRQSVVIGGSGQVWGGGQVACFTETPLAHVQHFCGSGKRYAPYGVMISKSAAWEQGGRPVIYLPEHDRERLFPDREDKWRVVRFDGPGSSNDYTDEREWRVPLEFDLKKALGVFVLVKEHEEVERVWQVWGEHKAFALRSVLAIEDLKHFV